MHALESILGDLCCSKIPLSEEVIEKATMSLEEAQIELKEAEAFLAHSAKSVGPPDALFSRVVRMTLDLEVCEEKIN